MAFPASDEIHLLLVEEAQIDEELLVQYALLMSSDEVVRHDRIHTPADRKRYLVTRAAVRIALSHFVPDVAPADWQFTRNAHGRPAIADAQYAAGLTFNISHAQGLIVIAIARAGELGVDVESVDRTVDVMAIAQRYFAAEEFSAMQALSETEQRARFFDLWTLKEAWVKATGTGLAKSLQHASFAFAENRIEVRFTAESTESSDRWQFWQLRPSNQHQIAIAYTPCRSASVPLDGRIGPRFLMNLRINKMLPMKSITPIALPPFRTN